MKLGTRIFCCNLLVAAFCLAYPVDCFLDTLRTRYLEGVEDPLVDQANILAELAGLVTEHQSLAPDQWQAWFDRVYARRLDARIYALHKDRVDERIYITDQDGLLLFDSQNLDLPGTDYRHWRNVQLTLDGVYGARTTKSSDQDEFSSVMHISAPIMTEDRITGVLTVAKPTGNIWYFIEQAKPRIFSTALLSLLAAAILSYLSSLWLTRPIRRLTAYARAISVGRRQPFPRLDHSEIGAMGAAFQQMQQALEGKKYVEQYIQTLTHEMKSPLSAIRGAAELLEEPMADHLRQRFQDNIREEALRLQEIIDRMLELASLEARQAPHQVERISIEALVHTVCEAIHPQLTTKELDLQVDVAGTDTILGDAFLLHRALSNLLINAIDFSPTKGCIWLAANTNGSRAVFTILDQGPGIPEYARKRIFDKFYSLERPQGGKKSTGLGLNFVHQVAVLHGGSISLDNRQQGGVRATLVICSLSPPAASSQNETSAQAQTAAPE